MIRILVILLVAMFAVSACGGGDSGGEVTTGRDNLAKRESDLRKANEEVIRAFFDGDVDKMYSYFSTSFKERCPEKDFKQIMAFAAVFIGAFVEDVDDVTVETTDVRFEEDRAYVTTKIEVPGDDSLSADEGDDFSDYWVLEGGEWKAETDDENPCDFDDDGNLVVGGDDDDEPPATRPGSSRGEPVALGESVTSGDLRVQVLDVDLDATDAVLASDDFADPPAPGRRFVLITVRAEHAGDSGDETIDVNSSSFKLTGSNNLVYDGWDDSSCGFIGGEIRGEMFPGGSVEGVVCFQVPEDETDFVLILSPFFSFSDNDRRYLALQ